MHIPFGHCSQCWAQAHLRGSSPVWEGPALGVLVDKVTAAVREHVTLEREVTNYWVAKYFEQELARNPDKTWTALLLHWVRQARPCSGNLPAAILGATPPVMHAAAL